jgi:hypothetical protein
MPDNPKDAKRLAEAKKLLEDRCLHRDGFVRGDAPAQLAAALASRDATIADLERRLAEARADVVRGFANAILHGSDEHRAWLLDAAEAYIAGAPMPSPRPVAAPPPPVAEASGEFGHPAPRNFDKERPGPGWKISDDTQRELQEMEQQQRESVARLRSAPQPTADHTEQARELAKRWQPGLYGDPDGLARELLELLTAAERAGAEKAVDYMGSMVAMDYDREACIAGALAARDAALTEGEEEHADRRKP